MTATFWVTRDLQAIDIITIEFIRPSVLPSARSKFFKWRHLMTSPRHEDVSRRQANDTSMWRNHIQEKSRNFVNVSLPVTFLQAH